MQPQGMKVSTEDLRHDLAAKAMFRADSHVLNPLLAIHESPCGAIARGVGIAQCYFRKAAMPLAIAFCACACVQLRIHHLHAAQMARRLERQMLKRTPNKHEPVDIGDGLKVFGGNGGFDGYTIAGKHYDAETSKRIDAVAKALGFTLHEAAAMVDKTDAAKTPEPELPIGRIVPRYRRDGTVYVVELPTLEEIRTEYTAVDRAGALADFLNVREGRARRLLKKYGFSVKKQSAPWNTERPVLFKVFFGGEEFSDNALSLNELELRAFELSNLVKAMIEREAITRDVMSRTDADDEDPYAEENKRRNRAAADLGLTRSEFEAEQERQEYERKVERDARYANRHQRVKRPRPTITSDDEVAF
jgi:hypothetical protein